LGNTAISDNLDADRIRLWLQRITQWMTWQQKLILQRQGLQSGNEQICFRQYATADFGAGTSG
jgi:hypothetical protein